MEQQPLVSTQQLTRFYGTHCAVKDLSFELGRGEVLGLLGPNGAGKSTTMQMITGNLAPSHGEIHINGIDLLEQPKAAKAELGFLPEQPPLYKEMTVDEYLGYAARLNRIPRLHIPRAMDQAKARCGLGDVGRRLIGNLSKGYQQRVGIAQAIIHTPAVVILDEPTVGLDPLQIREIRSLIRELGDDHSVILSSHILPEIQATCDRVQIINRGELVLNDSIEGLTRRMQSSTLVIGLRQPPPEDTLATIEGVDGISGLGSGRFRIQHKPEQSPAERLAERAVKEGWGLFELSPEQLSLESVFMELTRDEASATEAAA